MKLKTFAACFGAYLAAVAVLFQFVYRPWQATWGASEEEVIRPMVGDAVVKDPTFNATRAVTINATPEQIWPLIVQIGYRRAGFYSYDILDNDGIPSAEHIIPEYQNPMVGDQIPVDKKSVVYVAALEANRHLLLVFRSKVPATWAWGLYPVDAQRTRLVTRLRVEVRSVFGRVFLDAFEIIMMRKCMLGIKRRAER